MPGATIRTMSNGSIEHVERDALLLVPVDKLLS
jgi:hypothetical protein